MQRIKEIGLSRDERLEFSSYLLRRDITSWKQLDEAQVARLLDAIEGHELLTALFELRPPERGAAPQL
jgi:hypothetical protein